jgi:[acyl-carrier-protein] S-malonyltransferase
MLGLLFPGQGSQFVGMGRDLAETDAAVRALFEEADELLGLPLSRVCWEGPAATLTRTDHAQPAILLHSVAVWELLRRRWPDLPVAMAAGHSLGEFSAHAAAGTFDWRDALHLVRLRGQLMAEAGAARPGTMVAVLGLDDVVVERVCAEASGPDGVVVAANFNAPGQVVISGDVIAVERAKPLLEAAGARRVLPLVVSGAFHSPLVAPAREGLAAALAQVPMQPPRWPVVANVTGQPAPSEPDAIRQLLVDQLTSPVRWVDGVRTMVAAGVRRFWELGPGTVLSGLVRRIAPEADARSIGTLRDLEALEAEAATWN